MNTILQKHIPDELHTQTGKSASNHRISDNLNSSKVIAHGHSFLSVELVLTVKSLPRRTYSPPIAQQLSNIQGWHSACCLLGITTFPFFLSSEVWSQSDDIWTVYNWHHCQTGPTRPALQWCFFWKSPFHWLIRFILVWTLHSASLPDSFGTPDLQVF